MEGMGDVAVGIDLGTTYSCVGVWREGEGRVDIIPNDCGNRITPSCVAFNETERLVGDAALNQIGINATNTVFDAKRLMGRRFSDDCVQNGRKHWPFRVVRGACDRPLAEVTFRDRMLQLTAEEISAMVLAKMKAVAEAHLGTEVKKAVVTVPAHFNDTQRQATADAARIAGLEVLRIINEPTAACLAHGLHELPAEGEKRVLVFDLGGGTFDCSLLSVENGVFQVIATAGDNHLGGEDMDNRLVDHFISEFKRKYHKDLSGSPRAVRRLRTACEKAKRVLSSASQALVEVESLFEGIDFCSSITRARFEELCSDIFQACLGPLLRVLLDAGVQRSDVDEVVLVGGATRIPRVQQMVHSVHILPRLLHHPSLAAVQAAILSGARMTADMVLVDVTPLTLGVETAGGVMTGLIPRNTRIPTRHSRVFSTCGDNQTAVNIQVFQGERAMTRDCHPLGTFRLDDIPPAPRGVPQIEVTFDLNQNGMVDVSAREKASGRMNSVTVRGTGGLSEDDVQRMVADSQRLAEEDRQERGRVDAQNSLESYAFSLRRELTRVHNEDLQREVEAAVEWLNHNPSAPREEYVRRREGLESQRSRWEEHAPDYAQQPQPPHQSHHRVWCHSCQTLGWSASDDYPACLTCGETFVELAADEDMPSAQPMTSPNATPRRPSPPSETMPPDPSQPRIPPPFPFPFMRLFGGGTTPVDVGEEAPAAAGSMGEEEFTRRQRPLTIADLLLHGLLGGISPATAAGGDAAGGTQFEELLARLFEANGGPPGPPPAAESAVEALPEVHIGEEEFGQGLACTVCQDDFQKGQKVLSMPCKHIFHADCLKPWLELHNTCPICRCALPAREDTARTAADAGTSTSTTTAGHQEAFGTAASPAVAAALQEGGNNSPNTLFQWLRGGVPARPAGGAGGAAMFRMWVTSRVFRGPQGQNGAL